ncbi:MULTISPECIES: hypothetical protein [unclassified Streptomyces]|uniref:hypothetical protein n=1 Tax=unclassified Streptomyces TaxID=2593676 RepID=UPI003D7236F5
MSLPADVHATFVRGMDLPTLSAVLGEVGLTPLDSGVSEDWAWVTHSAESAPERPSPWELAGHLTGFRYQDRVPDPEAVESVFLAGTPACACPHGQHYLVPHCPDHPFQFTYSQGGFQECYFNVGAGRETRRGGSKADLLVGELLEARIVGRDTPYATDPGFNADGTLTWRIIVDHFALPAPPLTL